VGNYVIANPSNLGNFMIADTQLDERSPTVNRQMSSDVNS